MSAREPLSLMVQERLEKLGQPYQIYYRDMDRRNRLARLQRIPQNHRHGELEHNLNEYKHLRQLKTQV